jgi:lathosterol oxidase
MLYAVAQEGNFLLTWLVLTLVGFALTMGMSGALFALSYWKPSLSSWQRKSNPQYPKPAMVRREILQTLKGIYTATFCPALALHLVDAGWSHAYGGLGGYGWPYLVFTFVLVWVGSDLYEFLYHRLGHTRAFWWKQHKPHHAFANPSPFAVIADDHLDQLIRSAPMLFVPMILPINMDLLFLTYGAFFYGYGVYLHWGHELAYPDAHHPWINTSFQHYLHHARSRENLPIHTGFFFKVWDKIAGSAPDEPQASCLCAKCCVARGERTHEAFEKIEKPDYSVLFSPRFWVRGGRATGLEGEAAAR